MQMKPLNFVEFCTIEGHRDENRIGLFLFKPVLDVYLAVSARRALFCPSSSKNPGWVQDGDGAFLFYGRS